LPLLASAARRSRLNAGNMCGSGLRAIRIISQNNSSELISGIGGVWSESRVLTERAL
jgi:hypothetical protein